MEYKEIFEKMQQAESLLKKEYPKYKKQGKEGIDAFNVRKDYFKAFNMFKEKNHPLALIIASTYFRLSNYHLVFFEEPRENVDFKEETQKEISDILEKAALELLKPLKEHPHSAKFE